MWSLGHSLVLVVMIMNLSENRSYRYQFRSEYQVNGGNAVTHSAPINSDYSIGTAIQIGSSNPLHRDQIARGLDATTNYSRREYELKSHTLGKVDFLYRSGSKLYRSFGYSSFLNLPSWSSLSAHADDSALRDIALSRLKRRLADEVSQFQSIAPLAELREVRRLIRQIAGLGLNALLAAARAKRTGGRSVDKFLADTWLGFSFGAAPLVSSVGDLCGSIAEFLQRRDHLARFYGTAGKNWKAMSYLDSPGGSTAGVLFASLRTQYDVHARLSYRFISGVHFALESANDYSLGSHFGLTAADVVPAAWELLPYSWLFDYFSTVGAYLDDVFVENPGFSTMYVVENRRFEAEIRSRSTYVPPATASVSLNLPCDGVVRVVDFSRTRLSSLPRRILRFKTADEVGANAVNRLLNLTALYLKQSKK